MKKTVILLFLLLFISSSLFAGQFFGEKQNLNIDGAFCFMLLNNQRPKTAEEIRDQKKFIAYDSNAIGFKIELQYDNSDFPVDLYLNGSFTFPSKYKLSSETKNKFDYESSNNKYCDSNAKTTWTMTKVAAGALYDLNFKYDKEKLPLYIKIGGGLNYNILLTKDTGIKHSINYSHAKNFESIGIELKTDARYFIGSNIYAKMALDAGYSFLGFYSDMNRDGTLYSGTKVPIQFASGFNMTASLGLSYSF